MLSITALLLFSGFYLLMPTLPMLIKQMGGQQGQQIDGQQGQQFH